jgi:restriction endonuclease BglII
LRAFRLLKSQILQPGGSKSLIFGQIDNHFTRLGWREKSFDTKIVVDGVEHAAPTHKVDCFKNRVALEVEWNNKDPFFDRDLNNFRLLFELRAIDVGVIITRCTELQHIFVKLGRGPSYGNSTTHMAKLLPRLAGGGGGGCPVVVFGIRKEAYVDDQ